MVEVLSGCRVAPQEKGRRLPAAVLGYPYLASSLSKRHPLVDQEMPGIKAIWKKKKDVVTAKKWSY